MSQVTFGDGLDRLALAPALFGERDKYLAGNLSDERFGPNRANSAFVGATLDRTFRREHRDAPARRSFTGSARARLDHTDNRNLRKALPEARQSGRGSRVAG